VGEERESRGKGERSWGPECRRGKRKVVNAHLPRCKRKNWVSGKSRKKRSEHHCLPKFEKKSKVNPLTKIKKK